MLRGEQSRRGQPPGRQDRWLNFAGALELEFREAHLRRIRHRTRLWQACELLVAPLLLFLHFRQHAHVDGELHAPMWVAAAVASACSVALALLAALRHDTRHYLPVAVWLTPVRSMALAVMISYFVQSTGSGTALLTASTFGHFFYSGLLFQQALVAALLTLASYAIALSLHEVASGTIAYALVTVAFVQTLAAVVAFDSQLAARTLFVEHGAAISRAAHDGLTGLRNRRDFDERLEALWRKAIATREALSLFMFDVDHFKAFNDRYGHQAGDDVLRRIADTVRLTARDGDVVARYGGEEFVILAQNLDESSAAALAERMRAAIELLAIAHDGSSCAPVVTVSIGVAHIVPEAARSPAGAVQLADQNLYLAKQQGRNRCVSRGADYASLRTGRFDVRA